MGKQETVGEALRRTSTVLAEHSSTPRLDAEVLLAHLLGWSREQLLAEMKMSLQPEILQHFDHLVQRRAALEPVAYLVGHKEFYGLDFVVDQRVLIPRPETELLVDLAVQWVRKQGLAKPTIADLGTGSGCIAIALAIHVPTARIYALDRSVDALQVARINVERYSIRQQVALLQSDGLAALPEPVDLLVSNPPYTILASVAPGVLIYEPHEALDGGLDGLDAYRWLLPASQTAIRPQGAILLEIGADQAVEVVELAQTIFSSAHIAVHPDLAGYDRIVAIYNGRHSLRA